MHSKSFSVLNLFDHEPCECMKSAKPELFSFAGVGCVAEICIESQVDDKMNWIELFAQSELDALNGPRKESKVHDI